MNQLSNIPLSWITVLVVMPLTTGAFGQRAQLRWHHVKEASSIVHGTEGREERERTLPKGERGHLEQRAGTLVLKADQAITAEAGSPSVDRGTQDLLLSVLNAEEHAATGAERPLLPMVVHLGDGTALVIDRSPQGALSPELDRLHLWPDPARDELFVGGAPVGARWEIIDINGRVVRTGNTSDVRERVPLEGLPSGTYVFRAGHEGSQWRSTFIRQ